MLSDATLTADIIKQFAKNAVDSTMPFSFHYGTVKSTDPIEIEVEQKLILTENDLIFTTLVQDFDVDMYMEHTTEKTDLIHNHKATPVVVGTAGGYPFTQQDGVYDHENGIVTVTGTYTAIDKTGDEHNHSHEYKGVKTFTVNLKLAKDEKVLLLRIQGGQKFLVLDRVRTLNDTEFTNEFEGSGSSGSSGSGSDSGNTSGGGNSGSTDSGNGGNDSGSTDNENPDTGDNGNNSGSSVSDVINVTALMTALLSLTDEQKKEIGLTGVTIDDENITDSSTWSSQKIQDSVNANTFEISKLNETTELSGECCIPIVQGTETKKIKVDTLQSELNDKINAINEKLPEQATNENQLADKDFVNSSISTNTSHFIGTFNSLSELQASNKTITKNDYAFIVETDDVGNIKYNRYKWNGSEWLFEYALNNSSFTSNQWKTINSNITEEWKNSIDDNIGAMNTAILENKNSIATEITNRINSDTDLQNKINNKADAVSFYQTYNSVGYKTFAKLKGSHDVRRTAQATSHIIHINTMYNTVPSQSITLLVSIGWRQVNIKVLDNLIYSTNNKVITKIKALLIGDGSVEPDSDVFFQFYYSKSNANDVLIDSSSQRISLGNYEIDESQATVLNEIEINDDIKTVYSTTPRKIGTWIDGKDVYRVVLETTFNITSSGTIGTIEAGGKIVSLNGQITSKDETVYMLPLSGNHSLSVYFKGNNINIAGYTSTSFVSARLIVEYTK